MMKNFSKISIIILAFTNKVAVAVLGAGDIVNDPAHMAETIAGWSQQVSDMASQLQQLRQQYQMLQSQYQNLHGLTDLSDLAINPSLRQYLPSDYQTILQNGYGNAQSIRDSSRVPGYVDNNPDSESSQAFEANARQAAINRATAEEGYRQASQRFNDLQIAINKLSTVPDAKAMMDIQARIQIEQVMQQNEANKLAMLGQLAQAQKDLANQSAMERQIKSTSGGNVPSGW